MNYLPQSRVSSHIEKLKIRIVEKIDRRDTIAKNIDDTDTNELSIYPILLMKRAIANSIDITTDRSICGIIIRVVFSSS